MLTKREAACLQFLSDKMDASGEAIGRAIAPGEAKSSRGFAMIGNGEARRLSFDRPAKCALVASRHRPLWTITPAGRAAITPDQGERDGHG